MESFEIELGGRKLIVESGKMAKQANGAVLVRYGDTAVLATATASAKPREGADFFPLTVDCEEKMYSAGKVPGGFHKREGRPQTSGILRSRLIDRPIRPLFQKVLEMMFKLSLRFFVTTPITNLKFPQCSARHLHFAFQIFPSMVQSLVFALVESMTNLLSIQRRNKLNCLTLT